MVPIGLLIFKFSNQMAKTLLLLCKRIGHNLDLLSNPFRPDSALFRDRTLCWEYILLCCQSVCYCVPNGFP